MATNFKHCKDNFKIHEREPAQSLNFVPKPLQFYSVLSRNDCHLINAYQEIILLSPRVPNADAINIFRSCWRFDTGAINDKDKRDTSSTRSTP